MFDMACMLHAPFRIIRTISGSLKCAQIHVATYLQTLVETLFEKNLHAPLMALHYLKFYLIELIQLIALITIHTEGFTQLLLPHK